MTANVFISYSHKNADFTKELKLRLESAGITNVWRDEENLLNGSVWARAIDNALEESFMIILVISPASMYSAYVTYEWHHACVELDKELYCIYLEDCDDTTGVYGRLKSMQIPKTSFVGQLAEQDWKQVISEIQERVSALPFIRSAGELLIAAESTREEREQAARQLGEFPYHKSQARLYLHRGIKFQFGGNGDGVVHKAIAQALAKVGDSSSVVALWEAYNCDEVQGYEPARHIIYQVLNQLSRSIHP